MLDIACFNLIIAEANIEQTDSRHTSGFTSAILEMRKPSQNLGNRVLDENISKAVSWKQGTEAPHQIVTS